MAIDISQSHRPVSDFLNATEESDCRISDRELSDFSRDGFLSGVPILSEAQCDQLCDELACLSDPQHEGHEYWYEYHSNESADPDTVLFHALGAWRITPGMHDLLWHPRLLAPARQLLAGDVRFWHDQLFCKPAHHGGVVAWHQDYSYWTRTKPMAHLTCWIGLDDSTADNGCLQYVAGSHTWDLLPVTGLAGDMHAIREVLTQDQWERFNEPVAAELKRGQAAFHHPLTIHGSFENRTAGPRRAVVINLVRDGVCSDSDEPLLDGVPVVPRGQPLAGRFFPLLG